MLAMLLACFCADFIHSADKSSRMSPKIPQQTPATDSRGHVLLNEWASYAEAQSKDRPQQQEEILLDIKAKAKERRLSWDFWDAASQYVDVASSRNWKVRTEKESELRKEVEQYDEPIVTLFFMRRTSGNVAIKDYVRANKDRLLSSKSPVFWKNTPEVRSAMSSHLVDYLGNDYEYALWALYLMSRNSVPGEIKDYEAGKLIGPPVPGDQYYSYPLGAYFEYLEAEATRVSDYTLRTERRLALEKVANKYSGKAIALYPRKSLLQMEFEDIDRKVENHVSTPDAEGRTPEQAIKALYEKCKKFESDRKHLSGEEAAIVSSCDVDGLIKGIEREAIGVSADGNEIKVILGNLYSAKVSIFPQGSAKKVYSTKVKTSSRKFYVPDTVTIKIPTLDDGQYEVFAENGSKKSTVGMMRYSLALASRLDNAGRGVYAAASKSGRPIGKADIHLLKNGSEIALVKDFTFGEGFSHLPETISSKINEDSYYELKVTYKDSEGVLRSSQNLSLSGREKVMFASENDRERYISNIYLDKGAYNPGEVVHFKAVLGQGNMFEVSCVQEGKKVNAALYDSNGKLLEETQLTTNSFGSVAGEFTLPSDVRGGTFSVRVDSEGKWRSSTSLRVDQFVLPSYFLEFDPMKDLYLPGDEVKISGKISAYSGHNLSAATVTYTLMNWDRVLGEGELETDESGKFTLTVPTDPEKGRQHISVKIKVIDDTGETQEYSRGVYVSDSVNLQMELQNGADAEIELTGGNDDRTDMPVVRPYGRNYASLVEGGKAKVKMTVRNAEWEVVPSEISYTVRNEKGDIVKRGKASSGDVVEFDLEALGQGLYHIDGETSVTAKASGKSYDSKSGISLVYLPEDTDMIDSPVEYIFRSGPKSLETSEPIKVQIASASAPIWAVVELFGDGATLIESRLVHLDGERGKSGSAQTISFSYKAEYPDAVRVSVVFFRDGRFHSFQREYKRVKHYLDLPLEFSSFEDKAFPGKEYTISLKSDPGTEAVMSIYDKSVDRIATTWWGGVSTFDFSVPYISVNAEAGTGVDDLSFAGSMGSMMFGNMMDDGLVVTGYGVGRRTRMMAKSAAVTMNAMVMEESADVEYSRAAEPEAAMGVALNDSLDLSVESEESSEDAGVPEAVREDFATTLAFEPFIHSDGDGNAEVKFTTSDKLSTFLVKVYAHDRKLRNAMISREMVVSIPVKVSVSEPSFLYTGDKYNLAVTLSSNVDKDVPGILTFYQYDGKDHENSSPIASSSKKVTVKAHGGLSESFPVNVPSKGDTERGMMVVFKADDGSFSDAVFVSVPVKDNLQTLTEAHSAVYLAGQDKNKILASLRSQFVNVSGYGATYDEISIIDMVKDAIPSKVEPKAMDVISLTEALYVRLLAEKLLDGQKKDDLLLSYQMPTYKLKEKISACRNADGGFGWFEGMSSSPIVTAVVLERYAKLNRLVGMDASTMKSLESSVKFLDKNQFDAQWPTWCGGLSLTQYLLVRSYYTEVSFDVKTHGLKAVFDKRMKDFKDYVKDYLVPSKERGLNGQILPKARRLLTITNLVTSEGGTALAKAWGVNFSTDSRLKSSLEDDVLSLVEYAIDHNGGGMYYPNAVMPFRGLLESEAYAHALICDLFSDYAERGGQSSATTKKIADGIRIWLMLQKETQKWDEDPAFTDAIYSIMNGDDDIKQTRIILMKQTYQKPFSSIKAAGNEMTVERKFYRMVPEKTVDKDGNPITVIQEKEIAPGTVLSKGDRIKAVYKIWNKENRSFVLLKAPREAALRPVNQLSGMYGWGIRPMMFADGYSFQPHGYRDVRSDRTEYYFDSYPEEGTTVQEEFYVMQTGVFHAPVVEIESLYAPHYRANAGYGGNMTVK